MIYGYLIILGFYMLLFFLSRKEEMSAYQTPKRHYPGEILFLKAAAYFMKKCNYGRNRGPLGEKLKLLYPALPKKQQVESFYIRKYSLVLLVIFIGNMISLCVGVSARTTGILQEGGYIYRNAYGEGDIEVALSAQMEGEEPQEIFYTVEERKYTKEEINQLYAEISAYLQEIILGENRSLDAVTKNLELVDMIEGYPFEIFWESSSYSIVHTDGTVFNETLEEPEMVTLTAHLQYDEMEFEEVFPIRIQPAVFTEKEMVLRNLESALEEQNQASQADNTMILPEQIGEKHIIWKEVIWDSSGYFFLLICFAAVLVFILKDREVEVSLEKRNRELLLDYPEIINKLILYMGAGMTIRNTFWKMGEDYKKQKASDRKRYVYEEILLLCFELQSGVSETEAYAHLGKRCQLQSYMKLSALLSQNLRKGSNDLLILLRQEAEKAFAERKNTARKLGEEAGTKLLIPMMMMLCIVMVIIMIPAYFSFSL